MVQIGFSPNKNVRQGSWCRQLSFINKNTRTGYGICQPIMTNTQRARQSFVIRR